ncbi:MULTISPECIES: guanylate kinase [Thermaerobacter]|uniref:Guanylate kinase n=1 Tax=Thermaerobacter subterraneus DSM 13965 TaxID=867903 RepID=K6PYC9_9FIRM|nr:MULTISPECIES: guanylate kinase [Thermaerobacter]EKP93743.1 guanylate kinase [Thermaerobacter subterraneus DSM 13965]QIA26886.1 guanylate kinase [Thermaerobacter sp. PB12/4term]
MEAGQPDAARTAAERRPVPADSRSWPGLMIVLSAPSGAGKGTIRERLQKRLPGLVYAVSVTTRPRRPHEVDGVDYHFVSPEEFQRRVEAGELVEWARVYGNYYGTPREPMETWLREGRDVICEKDVQGALKLMDIYPDAVYIFAMPPSLEELERRLERRGTESEEARRQRLASADFEMACVDRYDYVVVNDDPDRAADDIVAIIRAEKLRARRRRHLVERVRAGGRIGG